MISESAFLHLVSPVGVNLTYCRNPSNAIWSCICSMILLCAKEVWLQPECALPPLSRPSASIPIITQTLIQKVQNWWHHQSMTSQVAKSGMWPSSSRTKKYIFTFSISWKSWKTWLCLATGDFVCSFPNFLLFVFRTFSHPSFPGFSANCLNRCLMFSK